MRTLACLLLAALLSGCMSPRSYFFPPDGAVVGDKGAFSVTNPANSIVILYTPGSATNDTLGSCGPGMVPTVLRSLEGSTIGGKRVLIHMYCSLATGMLVGGMSMAEARAPDLERVVASYGPQGVPPRQIFVAGHSMGGWAAVLVSARRKVEIGGIIAFAPANGVWEKHLRRGEHWAAVERQRTAVVGLDRMTGLVYAFHGDTFNAPEDLEFLGQLPGLNFVALQGSAIGDGSCGRTFAHALASTACFDKAESERIRTFIARSMGNE